MSRPETRLRTTQGTLVVTDQAVRLERGTPRRSVQELPREQITQIRLTSRFHMLPLILGGLLLAGAAALTLLAEHAQTPAPAPTFLASLLLVLVVTGLFCLLALPLSMHMELRVASAHDTIRVRTGYHRRARIEQVHARLNEQPPLPQDLASCQAPRQATRPTD